MLLLSGSKVSKEFGATVCFRDADFEIRSGRRIGLIGANGCGKTTLLRAMAGEEDCEGTIDRRRDIRIGILRQEPSHPPGTTVRDAVMEGASRAGEIRRRINEINHAVAADDNSPEKTRKLLKKLGDLQSRFEAEGGHEIEWRADAVLDGVGFPHARLSVSQLEEKIIATEQEIEELQAEFNDPEIYQDGRKVKDLNEKLETLRTRLEALEKEYYSRA
jgi:ATP-binding cassette subfamily F protein 3